MIVRLARYVKEQYFDPGFYMLIDPNAENYSVKFSDTEIPLLQELRETTSRELEYDNMLSGPVVGAFLKLMVKLAEARNVLEVGTFTGYATLWMATGLPSHGCIVTCESNSKYEQIARHYFDRYTREIRKGDGPEIRILTGPALETLPGLLKSGVNPKGRYFENKYNSDQSETNFDLIFIDADKENYPEYFDLLFPVLRPGGVMVIDNAFWGGKVWANKPETSDVQPNKNIIQNEAKPDNDNEAGQDYKTRAIDRLNRVISREGLAQNVLLTVRDGLHLVRKKMENEE